MLLHKHAVGIGLFNRVPSGPRLFYLKLEVELACQRGVAHAVKLTERHASAAGTPTGYRGLRHKLAGHHDRVAMNATVFKIGLKLFFGRCSGTLANQHADFDPV